MTQYTASQEEIAAALAPGAAGLVRLGEPEELAPSVLIG